MLLPQCNVSRFSHRREIRVNACWICHSSVIIAECMQRHTNKLSVTFLINNSTSCCWEKRGGVKKAQSTTGTSMIDSGLRLLICSPKNSHVACELQIIVKNTQSLTYTCTYNKVVIKCTYKKNWSLYLFLIFFEWYAARRCCFFSQGHDKHRWRLESAALSMNSIVLILWEMEKNIYK